MAKPSAVQAVRRGLSADRVDRDPNALPPHVDISPTGAAVPGVDYPIAPPSEDKPEPPAVRSSRDLVDATEPQSAQPAETLPGLARRLEQWTDGNGVVNEIRGVPLAGGVLVMIEQRGSRSPFAGVLTLSTEFFARATLEPIPGTNRFRVVLPKKTA